MRLSLGRSVWMVSAALCWLVPSLPPAVADVPVRAVTAEEFTAVLQRERGNVLIVNFWATWCSPCLKEVPDLLAVESALKNAKVKLIGVSVDDPTPGARLVEQFRQKYFPAFRTLARAGGDIDDLSSVIDPSWNEVVPTTYIIDRTGKVRARIQGKKSQAEFKAAVEAVL